MRPAARRAGGPGVLVKFNGTDHPFDIVGVNAFTGLRVHRAKPLIKGLRALPFCKLLEGATKRRVFVIFREINVVEKGLNIKTGAAHKN